MSGPSTEKIAEAAQLWSRYHASADKLEAQARDFPAVGGECLRKAMVFRKNANTLYQWMAENHLVKGYPIPKKFKWKGMGVSIENPAGSVREWYDPFEKRSGATLMCYDYGYLRGTEGVDGDKVDAFFGPHPDTAPMVYVIRQMKGPDFLFYDEDKCMIGFEDEASAKYAYRAHYDSARFLGSCDAYPVEDFLRAVKATKRAPAPVGGWHALTVQQRMSDNGALPQSVRKLFGDQDMVMAPTLGEAVPTPYLPQVAPEVELEGYRVLGT